jgi:hypothetical protein
VLRIEEDSKFALILANYNRQNSSPAFGETDFLLLEPLWGEQDAETEKSIFNL